MPRAKSPFAPQSDPKIEEALGEFQVPRIAPSELNTYYKNPRRGDIPSIIGSLKAHGQYKPIVVNRGTHTGRSNEVLAGNHTLMAFRELLEADPASGRWDEILVHWVDVDEPTAAKIVAVDNRTSEIGGIDNDALYELLTSIPDLDGTGYDQDYLDMLAELDAGAPDLDKLADEVGDRQPTDDHEGVKLELSPALAGRWRAHRSQFSDDDAALTALLDLTDEA